MAASRRPRARLRRTLLAAAAALALAWCPPALAQADPDEQELAERYAPVVRLVEQEEECGPGEPYEPLDVELLFDEPTVSLRGPWNPTDLVAIGPSAGDVADLWEYHLDFPGYALDPGCAYERWSRRLLEGSEPAIYAHVAADPGHPGKLALQYWLFYAYNDWNNLHEGDWEMIQLVFDAATAAEALERDPVEIGYSQHEGAEQADWGDDKLELVDGRPVVYPAAGSHANFFDQSLHLGSSAEQGVGCDDTRGPHVELSPRVITIPSDEAAAREAFPWIAFEGRWGELQEAFYNGPTGPSMKGQWTEPILWAEDWRPRSYAVPTGGVFGTGATDFFCTAIGTGSRALVTALRNPALVLLGLGAVLVLTAFGATRTAWRPVAPLRVARRRSWGQILSAAGRMYVRRPKVFLGIGLLLIPLGAIIAVCQTLLLGGFGLLGVDTTGEAAGASAFLVAAVGTTLTLLGLTLVQAATAWALVRIDRGEPAGIGDAYRAALADVPPLLGAAAVAVAVWFALSATVFLFPLAIWLAVRWSLLAQAVVLEGHPALASLRRSSELVRDRWLRVASLVGVSAVLALGTGPLLGALLILLTDTPLPLLNVVAGVVYALVLPFVALVTAYVYLDARTRHELGPTADEPDELPAEIELAG